MSSRFGRSWGSSNSCHAGLAGVVVSGGSHSRAREAMHARLALGGLVRDLGSGAVRLQQLEHLLGVLEPAALAEVDVLLVERHRLGLAAAEPAQRLRA